MKNLVAETIKQMVLEHPGGDQLFREPLIGYASALDPIFKKFKEVVHPGHLLPQDLLPEGKSILAFFIPFTREVIRGNQEGQEATRFWAETYVQTNALITQTCFRLKEVLGREGVSLEFLPPTYQFDKTLLMAAWSHRHAAYACGLGAFGLNNLLITAKGCGGRLGTAVLDLDLEPNPRGEKVYHCFHHTKGCRHCLQVCPVQALPERAKPTEAKIFDRHRCYGHCRQAADQFRDLGYPEVCGKCSTGPCAYID